MLFPQTLFLYVGYIKISIPDSLDEAAEIDGLIVLQLIVRIIFPMLKPCMRQLLIINALWFWNDFMLPLLILNKDSKMWTLPLLNTTTKVSTLMTMAQVLHLILWEL